MDDTKTKTRYGPYRMVFRAQISSGFRKFDKANDEFLGYKWTRDYDSTDEENVWDRIGSIFGGNTDRSGNDSVSEGDYCIHDHRRDTV